jgi:signal transduction histidine kinase
LAVGVAYYGYREAESAVRLQIVAIQNEAQRHAREVEGRLVDEIKTMLKVADEANIPFQPPEEAYRRENPQIRTIVTLDDGIFYTWPKIATQTVQLDRALAPPQYGIAEEEELADGGDLERAIELYVSCLTNDVSLPWQRLARTGIAACERRLNRPRRALQQYELLLLTQTLPDGARYRPRRFDILMAKIDVLGNDLGLTERAGREAMGLLAQINAGGSLIEDVYDARMLFDRIERYAPGEIDDIQQMLERLGRMLEDQRTNVQEIELAKTLLSTQFMNSSQADVDDQPGFVFEPNASPPFGVAYLPVPKPDHEGQHRVVALTVLAESIYDRLDFLLADADRNVHFRIEARSTSERAAHENSIAAIIGAFSAWQVQPTAGGLAEAKKWPRGQIATLIGVVAVMFIGLLGTVILMVVTIRRQLALAQLKNDFVANVSHELKTPLALIRLFGETLMTGRVHSQEKAHEYYGIITRESERLTRLIDNILDFSSIESGRKQYEMSPCDLPTVVRQTLETYRLQFEHDHVQHDLFIESGLPKIQADPEAIAQVLLNLINNALKYSPREKWVRVDVRKVANNGSADLCVTVEDHGSGIGPSERGKLFDPFYRIDSDETKRVRGAGLGLAVVKHVLDAHHGRIEVDSDPGRGSAFKLFFPIKDSGYADVPKAG